MTDPKTRKSRKVPRSSASRLARFGGLGASVAGNMLVEGVKRVAKGDRPKMQDLLLTPGNASRVAEELSHLRGAAMKVGQLMSMDGGDFIPPELAAILAKLRASAHSMPPAQLKRVLNDNWGHGWLGKFNQFRVEPIAAASIGQVHRAETTDGRDIALKIQYPGVRESIDSDVDNVARLIKIAGLAPEGVDLSPFLAGAKEQLHQEADYKREALYLRRFRDLLKDDDAFVLPELHDDLTTENILAMSYIEGAPIDTLAEAPQEIRNQTCERLIDLLLRELLSFRLVQTDPNFANYFITRDQEKIALLDFGATREISDELSNGYRLLLRYGLEEDWDALLTTLVEMGLIGENIEARHAALMKDFFQLTVEPMHGDGPYDFGASDLSRRISEKGVALRTGGFDHVPPAVAVFLHRKIAGVYLLAAKLRARINVRKLIAPYLDSATS